MMAQNHPIKSLKFRLSVLLLGLVLMSSWLLVQANSPSNLSEAAEVTATPSPTATLDPDLDPAEAYYNRGLAYYNVGEFELAISDFTHAIELDPEYAPAYNNRGLVYRTMDELDLAIADYDKAIELDPQYALAYINRGVAYNQMGEFEQTISDATSAIEIDPTQPSGYGLRGLAYFLTNQYELALADYQKYEELTGSLLPFMEEQIAEMEAALEQ